MPDLHSLIPWFLQFVISGGIIVGVKILYEMRRSIDTLNGQVAKIIEKTAWHGKIIDDHSDRLKTLESRKPGSARVLNS